MSFRVQHRPFTQQTAPAKISTMVRSLYLDIQSGAVEYNGGFFMNLDGRTRYHPPLFPIGRGQPAIFALSRLWQQRLRESQTK